MEALFDSLVELQGFEPWSGQSTGELSTCLAYIQIFVIR